MTVHPDPNVLSTLPDVHEMEKIHDLKKGHLVKVSPMLEVVVGHK